MEGNFGGERGRRRGMIRMSERGKDMVGYIDYSGVVVFVFSSKVKKLNKTAKSMSSSCCWYERAWIGLQLEFMLRSVSVCFKFDFFYNDCV